jgi:DNA-binding transcriptional LysR family regulator
MNKFLLPAGVKPLQVVDVQFIGALPELVNGQFGVGATPSWTVAPEIRAGRVVAVRLGRNGLKRNWVAAATKVGYRQPWLRDFVHLIAACGPSSGMLPLERGLQ